MKLNQLSDNQGARQNRKRIGRGIGSGTGKTSGAGHKGQNSRSGVSLKGFEGGQMPLNRRLPKRGFKNIFRKHFVAVNLGRLQSVIDAGKLDPKKPIDVAALQAAGVINKPRDGVRLLAKGALNTKVDITVAGASKAATAAVEKAGGSLTLIAVKPAPTAATPRKSAAPAATGA
jgi:large subunit ribosomal protein L15